MKNKTKIILGSSSVWRRKVLIEAGWDFEVIPPNIDEKAIRDDNPAVLTTKIALAKADAVKLKCDEPAIIITSDQVAVYKGEIREKPENKSEARLFLRSYADAPVSTVTAVVVTNTINGKQQSAVDIATVTFSPIPDYIIDQFINEAEVMNAGGAFIVDNPIISPYVLNVKGDLGSVQGLPMILVESLVKKCD